MFEEFVKKLSVEIQKPLPGFSAQKKMAPLGRMPFTDYLNKDIVPKKSAVLILLYPHLTSFSVNTVLILRPENEGGNHAGQISFPGGGFDVLDKDMATTALRETEEEIGVDRNSVSVLGQLSPLYIPVSNFMVYPFVGVIPRIPQFKIHPAEVKELVEIEVKELFYDKNKKSVERFIELRGITLQVPCYEINGAIIWGATAMIISEFAEIIGRIKSVNSPFL